MSVWAMKVKTCVSNHLTSCSPPQWLANPQVKCLRCLASTCFRSRVLQPFPKSSESKSIISSRLSRLGNYSDISCSVEQQLTPPIDGPSAAAPGLDEAISTMSCLRHIHCSTLKSSTAFCFCTWCCRDAGPGGAIGCFYRF